ncbi:MAG: hypothetical protein ACI4NR_01550, partial [Megasphaera sp.]|uniref:hypothetical protein n=1 Tax=Megasphaera sp. TaxID=2023260 RepID=UPI003F0B55A7
RTSHSGVHSVHCSVFKGHLSLLSRDDLFILANQERFVKEFFEVFFSKDSALWGLAPTAHLVYYFVKVVSRGK